MSGISRLIEKTAGRLTAELFAFISTPQCVDCGSELDDVQSPICRQCREAFEAQSVAGGPVCLVCRKPSESACDCAKIKGGQVPSAYYYSDYTETMKTLIHRFKFEGDKNCGRYLISSAVTALRQKLESVPCDMVIPLPMRRLDINERGFNQTHMIAETLASALNRPCRQDVLIKTRKTELQALLPAEKRWRNVIDAFGIAPQKHVHDAAILLVDDIITTGATCFEAARTLYLAGARIVTVFAVASAE